MPELNEEIIRGLIILISEAADAAVEKNVPFKCEACGTEFAPGGTAEEKENAALRHYGIPYTVHHVQGTTDEEKAASIERIMQAESKRQAEAQVHHEQARFRVN